MTSMRSFAAGALESLERRVLRRRMSTTDRIGGLDVVRDGRRLTSYCCNDYLGLSQHPRVKAAAARAAERHGAGAGGSRLVTGNHSLYGELEAKLAEFKATEAALVFGSGFLANAGTISALATKGDLIAVDELSHACIHAGARMSRAETLIFPHNDVDRLAAALERSRRRYRHVLIVTEGVFSMDGDLAPLRALVDVARECDAWLAVDDAHAVGVIGGGRGSSFEAGIPGGVPVQLGTLSKAVGSYGGYACAPEPVVDLLTTRARTLVYSTGLPPATVAASAAALDLMASDPELVAMPLRNARRFTEAAGLRRAVSAIVPVVLGDANRALRAQAMLEEEGYLVTAIREPTVPRGTDRLRCTFTAAHEEEDIDRLADLVRTRVLGGAPAPLAPCGLPAS